MTALTRDEYVAAVLEMDREKVTNVYRQLYREADSIVWTKEEPFIEGTEVPDPEYLNLSDEDVKRFAEQDYWDGPDAWAFIELAKEE